MASIEIPVRLLTPYTSSSMRGTTREHLLRRRPSELRRDRRTAGLRAEQLPSLELFRKSVVEGLRGESQGIVGDGFTVCDSGYRVIAGLDVFLSEGATMPSGWDALPPQLPWIEIAPVTHWAQNPASFDRAIARLEREGLAERVPVWRSKSMPRNVLLVPYGSLVGSGKRRHVGFAPYV